MNSSSTSSQMSGQMFTAADSFARATPMPQSLRYHPTSKDRSPYIALHLDKGLINVIREKIKTLYDKHEGSIIPLGWNALSLEPPSRYSPIKVLGAANNYRGLQILMLSVNGTTLRKDGIPLHAIWSHDNTLDASIYKDDNYEWPSRVLLDEPRIDKKTLALYFNYTDVMQRHERVLSAVELEAEDLARACYDDAISKNSVRGNLYDYLSCAVDIHLPSKLHCPVRRIEHHGASRIACDVGW